MSEPTTNESVTKTTNYENIASSLSFNTKVVGVTFEGRQEIIASLVPNDHIVLYHDADNAYDKNAVAVKSVRLNKDIGFVSAGLAKEIAGNLDAGDLYMGFVTDITGGGQNNSLGVNISVGRKVCKPEPILEAEKPVIEEPVIYESEEELINAMSLSVDFDYAGQDFLADNVKVGDTLLIKCSPTSCDDVDVLIKRTFRKIGILPKTISSSIIGNILNGDKYVAEVLSINGNKISLILSRRIC